MSTDEKPKVWGAQDVPQKKFSAEGKSLISMFLIALLIFAGSAVFQSSKKTSYLPVAVSEKIKPTESGLKALEALKRFEAKVEIGLSYEKFNDALGETWYTVKKFCDSKEAQDLQTQQLALRLQFAVQWYKRAAENWKQKLELTARGQNASQWDKFIQDNLQLASKEIKEATELVKP